MPLLQFNWSHVKQCLSFVQFTAVMDSSAVIFQLDKTFWSTWHWANEICLPLVCGARNAFDSPIPIAFTHFWPTNTKIAIQYIKSHFVLPGTFSSNLWQFKIENSRIENLRTVARNVFIANLAVSDLCLCMVTMPLTLIEVMFFPLYCHHALWLRWRFFHHVVA